MKVAAIFRMKLKQNRTSTATARPMSAVTGRRWVIGLMAETAADAVDARVVAVVREAVGVIVDAADVPAVAAGGIAVGVAGLAAGDTRTFATDLHVSARINQEGCDLRRGLFWFDLYWDDILGRSGLQGRLAG